MALAPETGSTADTGIEDPRQIAKGIKKDIFDPRFVALDFMSLGMGGLVSHLTRKNALTQLAKSKRMNFPNMPAKLWDSIKGTFKQARRVPRELWEPIKEVGFVDVPAKGQYYKGGVSINPSKAAGKTIWHELTHGMLWGGRNKTLPLLQKENLLKYISRKVVDKGEYKNLYKAIPEERFTNQVGTKMAEGKGLVSMKDYMKIYTNQLDETLKYVKNNLPKAWKESVQETGFPINFK